MSSDAQARYWAAASIIVAIVDVGGILKVVVIPTVAAGGVKLVATIRCLRNRHEPWNWVGRNLEIGRRVVNRILPPNPVGITQLCCDAIDGASRILVREVVNLTTCSVAISMRSD